MKKNGIIAFLTAAAVLASAVFLFGCSENGDTPGVEGDPDGGVSSSSHIVDLAKTDMVVYVVFADDDPATFADESYTFDAAAQLCTEVMDKTGAEFVLSDGSGEKIDNSVEIIIGRTNRESPDKVSNAVLGSGDWVIAWEDASIFVLGGGSGATYEAVEYLLSTYLDDEKDTFRVPTDLFHIKSESSEQTTASEETSAAAE